MSPLNDRDVNLPLETAVAGSDKKSVSGTETKTQSMEQSLRKKIAENNGGTQNGAYVSPSDAIQSPASQKLAGFKQRQINRNANSKKPAARTLFARTASSSSGLQNCEDVEQTRC